MARDMQFIGLLLMVIGAAVYIGDMIVNHWIGIE